MEVNTTIESEPNAPEVKEIQAKDMEIIRSPNYRSVYANVAVSGLTTQDVRVTFGLITEVEPRKLGIEEQIAIHMPPAFAHSVAQLILNQLKKWEKLYLSEEGQSEQKQEPVSEKRSKNNS
jgi:hypothetical protein